MTDREFWEQVKRGLLLIVAAIDKKHLKPQKSVK
jgi:hypothetical protein